ncbi:hypothetical protein ONS96_008530 [Cadophora gregata f. sp. sojae]|nr:hypothetical protein ONS96_008530 [Cadophora gregata f. sp. sojae]
MVHVVGLSRYLDYADGPLEADPKDMNYGYTKCVNLADKDQAAALINPDNYRLFAEMSMSPKTEWVAADPVPAAANPVPVVADPVPA